MADDLQYQLLKRLTNDPRASQRSLARHLGVSVGKVNYCIRALVDKGWVKANNFRRSDNKLAYAYLLTRAGMAAKIRLTRDFLLRKEREYETLQREIHELRFELMSGEGDTPSTPAADELNAAKVARSVESQRSN